MRGDRERSLQAGASDYVAKPVDTDQLLTLLRDHLAPTSPTLVESTARDAPGG